MKPETEDSWVITAEDASVAIRSYEIVGYRIVGLAYEGAYVPEQQEDGSLVVDEMGATALRDCLTESIRYNKAFRQRLIDNNLKDRKILPTPTQLDNVNQTIEKIEADIKSYKRARKVVKSFLAQEADELAA